MEEMEMMAAKVMVMVVEMKRVSRQLLNGN
jgi:hypothetical protein